MEPIRPDSDEVAARNGSTPEPERAAVGGSRKSTGGIHKPGRGGPGQGIPAHASLRRRGSVLPVLLVVLLALGGSWLLFQQYQVIQQLQSNLDEAQDWINRSKLSMARFEGRLSEADRELLESGSQITEKLAFLDSEMRKLWGVSNDRNRKAIEANKKAVEFLENKADYLDQQRAEQGQQLTTQIEQMESMSARLEGFEQRLAEVAERQQGLVSTATANDALTATLQQTQQELDRRLTVMGQRQTLSFDEMRARLDAVERRAAAAGDQSAVNALQSQFASLKEVVDSIDASRAQLTGRLLRLEERVQGGG